MQPFRIYVDTSVIGGCFDHEFAPWSNGLIQDFRDGRFRPVLSEAVAAEIRTAPALVRHQYAELLHAGAEFLPISDEALNLQAAYEERGILPARFRADMLHIALATLAAVDVLVSWNFKHIVRFEKIRLFNAVSKEYGYLALEIYSPREVTSYERR